jgi:hypothetical protein
VHGGSLKNRRNVYPSPNSSLPTAFTVLTGSSNQFVTLGASAVPIAAYRLTLNAPSRLAAHVKSRLHWYVAAEIAHEDYLVSVDHTRHIAIS